MNPDGRRRALEGAGLYLVCDGRLPTDVLAAVIGAGVDLVQLRMKESDGAEVLEIGNAYLGVCSQAGVPLVINDRPDLALALGADGVHLGQDDLPPRVAREILGPDVLIGRSTHSIEDIDAGLEEHARGLADYIAVGPVHETPTKPGRRAVGSELVAHAAGVVGFPWFAIGGIDLSNVADVVAAGARRIVVVRAIAEAADPVAAAADLKERIG